MTRSLYMFTSKKIFPESYLCWKTKKSVQNSCKSSSDRAFISKLLLHKIYTNSINLSLLIFTASKLFFLKEHLIS